MSLYNAIICSEFALFVRRSCNDYAIRFFRSNDIETIFKYLSRTACVSVTFVNDNVSFAVLKLISSSAFLSSRTYVNFMIPGNREYIVDNHKTGIGYCGVLLLSFCRTNMGIIIIR